MKVRTTIDIPPTDRIIIGAATEGMFRPATHEELKNFIVAAYEAALEGPRGAYEEMTGSTVAAIKEMLGS